MPSVRYSSIATTFFLSVLSQLLLWQQPSLGFPLFGIPLSPTPTGRRGQFPIGGIAGTNRTPLPVITPCSSTQHGMVIGTPEGKSEFELLQRNESLKSLVLGAVVGGISCSPFTAARDLWLADYLRPMVESNYWAQWEFDTDMGALQGGLFAIVYRYCVREDKKEQLGQGVVAAFVLVRTLSQVVVPTYCYALPLNCGEPLVYLDWALLFQLFVLFVESQALFGSTAKVLEYALRIGWIRKYPSTP